VKAQISMKIAVIGSGVSGLGAAYALAGNHEVVLYEREARLGGHAHTVRVDYDGAPIDVDVGFIVYNERNYPNLVGLFDALGVESQATDMSFAFSGQGLEWSSNFPNGVFAQKRNWANPRFLGMLADISRFNRTAASDLTSGKLENLTLGDYLKRRGFRRAFADRYLLPMGAAIWSSSLGDVARAPAKSFIAFFANHGLLQFAPPLWRTVKGGARAYVDRIGEILGQSVRTEAPVAQVRRCFGGVAVADAHGRTDMFDEVVLACHSDQALGMLADADAEERALLAAVPYAPNRVFLHRDPALMPKRKAAWGSWSYMAGRDGAAGVTYWMNRLQSLELTKPLFVSLNPPSAPDPALTFAEFACDHPQFDAVALAAQERFGGIQGRGGVWYAGAWLGHGFHEDGLTAGLRVALTLGGEVPWSFVDHRIPGGPLPAPAQALRRAA
jgi:predicted NAD/FAD-binding protein